MTFPSMLGALSIALSAVLGSASAGALVKPEPRFKAVAFDYFVIFDADSIVPDVEKAFPGKGAAFVKVWRAKQFRILLFANHNRPVCRLLRGDRRRPGLCSGSDAP